MIAGLLLAAAHPASAPPIAMPHIRYLGILPEIVMLGGAILLLGVASLVRRPLRVTVATAGTVVIAGTSLGLALWQWADVSSHGAYTTVDRAVVVDGFSVLVTVLVCCAMVLTALVGDGYLRREGIDGPEFHVLAMVSASGAMLMAGANDLIIVFLGLEILSISLYVLAAFNHRRSASAEAALKYFILGGFSSAIFVYGIALTYGATGSTNLTQIADYLSHNVVTSNGLLMAGLALLLVGFAFKVAAVPFHMWTPDVYQGSPSPVTGFMAAVAKAGGFAALLRVFVSSFGLLRADWQPIVYALAVLTLVVGAGLAIVQRDVKRMLAYSSINHAGFVLVGLQAATARGVSSALYYLLAYMFMVIGTFAVVTYVGRAGDVGHDLTAYRGLAGRQPLLAFALAVLLLAQAGAPFTTGFLAKLQVVVAAVDAHSVPLAVVAMATAALAAYFYLRLVVLMYSSTSRRAAGAGGPGMEPAGTAGTAGTAGGLTRGPAHDRIGDRDGPALPVWAGTERSVALATRLNAEVLLQGGAEPEGSEAPATDGGPVVVPRAAMVAIGLCVAVTVVFGVIPGPLVDFAHQATLFFLP
ncbi:MAG TPA: NADH-quinone oxidoreductase subunit N [Acidimicrobiales bacterium]|nr:NADH-quinone oxidoreductase subunit N [Acidimicrobiales bacterium]